jgi:hypothetical protein
MAFVDPDAPETRDLWSRYTIEFARRGLMLLDRLELHGPDAPPAPRLQHIDSAWRSGRSLRALGKAT